MLEFMRQNQIHILITCGVVCIILAILAMVIRFQSIRKKKALIEIELCVAVMMIADGLAYIFKGDPSTLGFWMVRISNFLVFLNVCVNFYFLNHYITAAFMETGRFEKLPKRLLWGFIIPSIGATNVLISAFTGWYYYFDENNFYHRGPLYILSFVFPFIAMVLVYSFVFQHHKIIEGNQYLAVALCAILPFVAGVIQIFAYGLSLMTLGTWLASVLLVAIALVGQNYELSKATNTELKSGLPNTYGYIYEVEKIINFQDITQYNGYYFDIVRMGQFNNKYGKNVGDDIIVNYAHTIRDKIDKDEILGRLGGNYFVALIKKTNTEKFLKLLSDVKFDMEINGEPERIHVSAVAGIYEIKSRNIAAGQIIGFTSEAVTYAKNVAHKPYIYMDEALQQQFKEVRHIEELTRKGLADAEFVPYYQPKVDIKTNKMIGAEALARWKHEGELIPPAKFVPTMERNGSICDLDFFILEKTCSDIKEWLIRDIEPVPISINFSRRNLGNPILAEAISKAVEKFEIPKKYIQIEITETLDDYPLDYLIGVVDALHRYGFTVALDDFGTGSTSINLLKRTTFDHLKIDKDFIDYSNEKEKQLLDDIIRLAHNIGTEVIAEGVEEKERIAALDKMGCTLIQGYVFDKALEKKDFEKKLSNPNY